VAGGVSGGPSVGGEAGRRYHTIINARTTAAVMMSNLFVSIVHPILPRQTYPAFAGRNKLGESLIKPCLVEDHNDAPQNHGYFGPGSPFRRPLIFVGAPDNSDYSGQNVRERHQNSPAFCSFPVWRRFGRLGTNSCCRCHQEPPPLTLTGTGAMADNF
jgi:hypothetical protein